MELARRLRILAAPFFLTFCISADANDAPTTAQKYGALPAVQKMSISPNGEMVAFRTVNDNRDIVAVLSLDKKKLVAGMAIDDLTVLDLYFLNDRYVILVGGEHRRVPGFRGEFNVSTAFALDVKTSKWEQLLTPGDVIYPGQSGLGSIVGLSDNQEKVYMPAYSGPRHLRNPSYSLMEVDLDSPNRPEVMEGGYHHTDDYFVSPEGEVLIRENYNNDNNLHEIQVPDGRGWRTIYKKTTAVREFVLVGLMPSLKSAVVIRNNDTTGRHDYYLMSLKDGQLSEPRFSRSDKSVEAVMTDINRVVHGVKFSGFNPSYRFFDEAVNKRIDAFAQYFPGHSISVESWSNDWKDIVFYVEGSDSSGSYYLQSKGENPQFLSAARPQIPAQEVHSIAKTRYKARDGRVIPTLLTLPVADKKRLKELPAVLMPHGGPASYDRIRFDFMAQALADRGYLVIQPQFRGSTGFGAEHYQAGQGEWGRRMQDDLSDAVAHFTRTGMIDPDRLCIAGASYGGYAALAGGAFTPDLYQCVVSIAGVSDLNDMLDDDSSQYGRDHWVISYFERSIANGHFGKKGIEAISPINAVSNYQAPVLLIHGENDEVVPINQSKDMLDALDDAGKSVSFIELDEENHYLMRGETRIKTMTHMLSFIDRHLADPEKTAAAE